jgi:hypothetical protein
MDALSRRQHAAEEAWAKEAQEFAASAYRAKLQSSKAGSERLARALPPPAPTASMLPRIAAHALRLGVREEVRACSAAPQSRSVALAVQWQRLAGAPRCARSGGSLTRAPRVQAQRRVIQLENGFRFANHVLPGARERGERTPCCAPS